MDAGCRNIPSAGERGRLSPSSRARRVMAGGLTTTVESCIQPLSSFLYQRMTIEVLRSSSQPDLNLSLSAEDGHDRALWGPS